MNADASFAGKRWPHYHTASIMATKDGYIKRAFVCCLEDSREKRLLNNFDKVTKQGLVQVMQLKTRLVPEKRYSVSKDTQSENNLGAFVECYNYFTSSKTL